MAIYVLIGIVFTSYIGLVDGYTYTLFKYQHKRYSQAYNKCQAEGLQLATIKTHDDLLKLQQYLSRSVSGSPLDMYTGMTWDSSNQKFIWPDDTAITWAVWRSGCCPAEPNCMQGYQSCGEAQNCVRLTTSFQFATVSCNDNFDVLCSKEDESTTRADPEYTTTEMDFTTTTIPATTTQVTTSITTDPSTTSAEITTATTTYPTEITTATTTYPTEITTATTTYPTDVTTAVTNAIEPDPGTPSTTNTTTPSVTAAITMAPSKPSAEITTAATTNIAYTSTSLASSSSNTYPDNTNERSTSQGTACPYDIDGNYPADDMSCQCYLEISNYRCHRWVQLLQSNITEAELRRIVEADFEWNIKPYIAVDKPFLSKYRRTKTSAPDDRASSESMGWLSVTLILLPVVLGLTLDLINAFQKRKGSAYL